MSIQDGYLEREWPLEGLIQWVEVELCIFRQTPLDAEAVGS